MRPGPIEPVRPSLLLHPAHQPREHHPQGGPRRAAWSCRHVQEMPRPADSGCRRALSSSIFKARIRTHGEASTLGVHARLNDDRFAGRA